MAIIQTTFLYLTEAGHGASESTGGFMHFYNEYLNIPGFEAWKFLNLAIFVGLMVYLLRKPLGEKFREQRDAIRADLIRAEEEKKAALARLTAIEARLANLESEKEAILTRAKDESEAERRRLSEQTRNEIARLREQADAEIARLAQLTRTELRRFSVDESVKLAEQKLRSQMAADTDARIVRASIQEIGGLN